MFDERDIWTNGRRGSLVCITATIYPHSIVATAEPEHITEAMTERALTREFPRHTFVFNDFGGDCLRADADRWVGDGIPGQGPDAPALGTKGEKNEYRPSK